MQATRTIHQTDERLTVLALLDVENFPDRLWVRGVTADAPNRIRRIQNRTPLTQHFDGLANIVISFSTH